MAAHYDPIGAGVISDLFHASIECFGRVLSPKTTTHELSDLQKRSLTRIHQSLILWGNTHQVKDGGLDSLLQKSQHVMTVVVAILRQIVLDLVHSKAHDGATSEILQLLDRSKFVEKREDDSESEFEDEDSEFSVSKTDVDETVAHLKRGMQRLNDLHASLITPALGVNQSQQAPDAPTVEDMSPYLFFSRCIRERFPSAATILTDRLGRTTWEQYQALQDMRLKAQCEEATLENAIIDTATKPAQSKFNDSGYVSHDQPSAATRSLYAPSIAPSSILSSLAEDGRSKYPALPEEARQGTPFECAACGRYIKALRKHEYKKHIICDLQPYSCIYESCAVSLTPFTTRMMWMNHMLQQHADSEIWKDETCPLCTEVFPEQKHTLLIHLAKHLEEISLLALPNDVDSECSSESDEIALVDRKGFHKAAEKVLQELKNNKYSDPFLNPVKVRDFPDYRNIIKHPMDLSFVTAMLNQSQYRSKKEFGDHLNLIWNNCLRYHVDPTDPMMVHALLMQKEADRLLSTLPDIGLGGQAAAGKSDSRDLRNHMQDSDDEPIMAPRSRKQPDPTGISDDADGSMSGSDRATDGSDLATDRGEPDTDDFGYEATSHPPLPTGLRSIVEEIQPPQDPFSVNKLKADAEMYFGFSQFESEEDLSNKPRCQRCRKMKKGCDRQRPCGRCRAAGIDREACVSEDEGTGRKGRYGRHMQVPPKKSKASRIVEDEEDASPAASEQITKTAKSGGGPVIGLYQEGEFRSWLPPNALGPAIFHIGEEVWLRGTSVKPLLKVAIERVRMDTSGTWEYRLRDCDGQLVEEGKFFPEYLLSELF